MGGLIKIGDGTTQRFITKDLMINCHEFVPISTAISYRRIASYELANNLVAEALFFAPVSLPAGVTITQFSARIRNTDTGTAGRPVVTFQRVSTDGGLVLDEVSYNTTKSPAWETVTSSALTEATSDRVYVMALKLESTAAQGSQITWAKVTYNMPSYDKTV